MNVFNIIAQGPHRRPTCNGKQPPLERSKKLTLYFCEFKFPTSVSVAHGRLEPGGGGGIFTISSADAALLFPNRPPPTRPPSLSRPRQPPNLRSTICGANRSLDLMNYLIQYVLVRHTTAELSSSVFLRSRIVGRYK